MLPRQALVAGLFMAAVSLSINIQAEDKTPLLAVAPFDVKAAEQHQQAWAKHLKVDVEITNSIGMKFRLIPAGEFQMGSPEAEDPRSADEQQHKVRITKAFYLGKYEVTQREWKTVMATEPWKGKDFLKEGDDYPAVYVSWEEAVDYCKKMSRKEEKKYRLPTEAEWEYACRGGKTSRFHFGDSDLGAYGWYGIIVSDRSEKNERYPHRVGTKRPNPFGLHDMHGNVWEWCSDWYDEKYYASSPQIDPQGPERGTYRVSRGGSWFLSPFYCRSAFRGRLQMQYQRGPLGFRVARSPGANRAGSE